MKPKIFLLISILFIMCNMQEITFYVKDSTSTTIPKATPVGLPYDLPIPTVTTSATQEFESQNVPTNKITSITLDQMTLTITNPADQNFSFLDAIYIYIMNSDGSGEQLIASKENINSSDTSIDLNTENVNLVDYLKQDSYKLKVKVKIKKLLANDVDIQIDLRFKVVAKLF